MEKGNLTKLLRLNLSNYRGLEGCISPEAKAEISIIGYAEPDECME